MFRQIDRDMTAMESATNSKTMFYGRIGTNTVWGFQPSNGLRGIAITDGKSGQVVINVQSLESMLNLLTDDAAPITEEWLTMIGYEYDAPDARWKNCGNDIELWQRDSGEWQICTPDANYNAIKLATFTTQHQLTKLLAALS